MAKLGVDATILAFSHIGLSSGSRIIISWSCKFGSGSTSSSGAIPSKKARKFKKPASSSKKKTLVAVEEPVKKLPRNLLLEYSLLVFKSETLMLSWKRLSKEANKKQTYNHACGSSEGAGFRTEVPDEQKGKSIDTIKGTSLKPWVPD
ncbi:hypothetical protein Tco_0767943 [Tanacetum coccineum]